MKASTAAGGSSIGALNSAPSGAPRLRNMASSQGLVVLLVALVAVSGGVAVV